jgi:hypothetical protein
LFSISPLFNIYSPVKYQGGKKERERERRREQSTTALDTTDAKVSDEACPVLVHEDVACPHVIVDHRRLRAMYVANSWKRHRR